VVCAREPRLMYIGLHARSAFIFMEVASTPEQLGSACAAPGVPAMALMDRDGMYGSPRFHLAMNKLGLKAHIGVEVSCTEGGRLVLLVGSAEGYKNLCRLLTRMKLRAEKGQGAIDLEEAREFSGGLICLTGGEEGVLAESLVRGVIQAAFSLTKKLRDIFGRE